MAKLLNLQESVRVRGNAFYNAEKQTRRAMASQLLRDLIQRNQRDFRGQAVAQKTFVDLDPPFRVGLDVDGVLVCQTRDVAWNGMLSR